MLVTKQLTAAIDFHSMEKNKYYESQWGPVWSTVWLLAFLKTSSFVFNTGLEEVEGE